MGACTSSRRAAAAKQQQQGKPPSKKKKKSKSKIYSAYASMDSISAEADRVSGVAAPRKTPYTRGPGGAQVTAFGFRRRVLPSTSAPPPVAITGTGRCSPHLPPTPPTTHVPVAEASKTNVPRANRFGFQLSPRCTAVLNNINAQLVANGSVDPNCNPLPAEPEVTTIAPKPPSQLTNGNTEQFKNPTEPSSMLPKPKVKTESRLLSKLPAPKSLLKPRAQSASNKNNIVKPVVAKPVIRPANTKSAKTEANRMVALQSSDSSPGSAISTSGCGTLSTESSHMSRPRTLDMVLGPRGCFDVRDVARPATAPVAKPEDLDEDEREEKACIDESLSEKPTEAWTETVPDEMSSSSNSYSEGIEEQQIEFPDNLTDKSADSLFSSCSSASSASSSDEPPAKLAEKKKSSSGASLSQLSDGSSEQRDFLIDDEIADQPGLTFMAEEGGYMGDDGEYMSETEDARQANFTADNTDNAEETTFNGDETYVTEDSQQPEMSTLIHEPPSIQGGGEEGGVEAQASPMRTPVSVRRHRRRSASTGTLSPCESITSDDLMLDFDESAVDSTPSRLAKSSQQLAELTSEMSGSEEILKEWSLMLGSATSLNNLGARPAPQLRSRASSGSDVQLVSSRMVRGSPLRPPRSANSGGPVLDAEEGFVRLEWSAYQSMLQDIVTFKTNLLKLKRLLLEAEVRNPFDTSLKQNGLYYSLAHSEDKRDTEEEPTPQEQLADLRRQVVFLQQQMGDKDRTISLLQQQMSKYCSSNAGDSSDSSSTSNAATQTERVRPVSSGAAIISQSYPSDGGPLVSSSEQVKQRSATRPAVRKPASSKILSALPRRTTSVVTKPN